MLDTIAVCSLLLARPGRNDIATERRSARRRGVAIAVVWMVAGLPAAGVMASYLAEVSGVNGEISSEAATIVLEPETWPGGRFPLLGYIDVGGSLRHGRWIVVLYRQGCPKCEKAVPRFEELARQLRGRNGAAHVALIELPPFRAVDADPSSPCLNGRLSGQTHWFVEAPLVCSLDDGIVTQVTTPADGSGAESHHMPQ